MTSTVDRPTVEVERIPMARVYALILAETKRSGRREPIGIRQNGPDSDIVCVSFASLAHMTSWCGFFNSPQPKPRRHPNLPIMFDVVAGGKWQGWSVQLSGDDPVDEAPALDVETAALIDEVTAERPACTCPNLAVELHQVGCDAELAERAALLASPECVDCGVLGGSHQESCAFVSRVDPEAAAAIPVVVVDLYADEQPSGLAACPATYYGAPCPGKAVYDDGRCGTHTTCVSLQAVADHFRTHYDGGDAWEGLNVLQRARLIEACQMVGWDGDWSACYQHIVTDAALRTSVVESVHGSCDDSLCAADDARVIVSELDDIADLSLAGLAEVADVEPEAPIDYVLPGEHDPRLHVVPSGLPLLVHGHEPVEPGDHEPVPIVVHTPADAACVEDDGRGGARMPRMPEAVSGE